MNRSGCAAAVRHLPFMDLSLATQRWQRWTVFVGIAATALLFWTGTPDTFGLPKATVLWLTGIALVGLGAVRVAWERQLHLPRDAWAIAVVALVVAATLATITSPTIALSIVGEYNRYTGLLSYATFAVAGLVVLRTFDVDEGARLLQLLAGLGLLIALHVALQADGGDPFGLPLGIGPVGPLGNANLLAGFLAVCAPAALWLVLSGLGPRWARIAGAVAGAAAIVATLLSESFQGPAAAVPGALLVLGVWWSTEDGRARVRSLSERVRVPGRALVAAAVVVLLLVAVASIGPARSGLRGGFVERGDFWRAALEMVGDEPLLGTGFDTYGQHFLAARPEGHAARFGSIQAESAHSVPLNLVAGGGIVVGLAWAAILVLTGLSLVRGLRRLDGEERLLLGGLGGAWLAYVVQSIVSFDVPALGLVHFVLAAAIVAIGTPPSWRTVVLPGAAPRRTGRRGAERVVAPTSTWVLLGLITVLGLGLAWTATRPLRADLAAADAPDEFAAGDVEGAQAAAKRATDLAPWQGRYWLVRAQLNEAAQEVFAAIDFAEEAARREPGSSQYALLAARLNERYGDTGAADPWYDAALVRDPDNPEVLDAVAAYAVTSDPARAIELLERSQELSPDRVGTLLALGAAQLAQGDAASAIATYERAVELGEPDADRYTAVAEALLEAGDDDRAVELLRSAAELNPTSGERWHRLGQVLEQTGDLDAALEAYTEALRWAPDTAIGEYTDAVARVQAEVDAP
jgi:putative inorganic carbon (HCO3(-)) transporter